MMATL
jgi:hypothetical protein